MVSNFDLRLIIVFLTVSWLYKKGPCHVIYQLLNFLVCIFLFFSYHQDYYQYRTHHSWWSFLSFFFFFFPVGQNREKLRMEREMDTCRSTSRSQSLLPAGGEWGFKPGSLSDLGTWWCECLTAYVIILPPAQNFSCSFWYTLRKQIPGYLLLGIFWKKFSILLSYFNLVSVPIF